MPFPLQILNLRHTTSKDPYEKLWEAFIPLLFPGFTGTNTPMDKYPLDNQNKAVILHSILSLPFFTKPR